MASSDSVKSAAKKAAKDMEKAAKKAATNMEKVAGTAAKTAARAVRKVVKSSVTVQFGGREFQVDEISTRAVAAAREACSGVKSVDVYIKPEDGVAYYAAHADGGDATGSVPLEA